MDSIIIRNLRMDAFVGIYPREKRTRQEILVSIAASCELRRPGKSDRLADTIDYKDLKDRIVSFVEGRKFNLIESVAESVAEICLSDPRISSVRVTTDKPGALTGAESVAVEIVRRRKKLARFRGSSRS